MCIFCDIIDKKIPSKVIYEDDEVLSILDISQTTKGHSLLIPKKHYDNMLEMPDDEFASLAKKANEIAKIIVKKMNANGCNLLVNTNEVAGQSVKHTHIHIIPRYDENDSIKISFNENKYDLDEILSTIKAN